jgi:hypothetical protein
MASLASICFAKDRVFSNLINGWMKVVAVIRN